MRNRSCAVMMSRVHNYRILLIFAALVFCTFVFLLHLNEDRKLHVPISITRKNHRFRFQNVSEISTEQNPVTLSVKARLAELQRLRDTLHGQFEWLQHPKNCSTAKLLACELDTCGFGCQVHQIAICLLIGYATGRTVLLAGDGNMRRYGSRQWSDVFLPLSGCTTLGNGTRGHWDDHHKAAMEADRNGGDLWVTTNSTVHVLVVPRTGDIKPKPNYLYLHSLPEDIANRLLRVHQAPTHWFVAQTIDYVLRYQPEIHKLLEKRVAAVHEEGALLVGVHIRRTDKLILEAKFFDLEQYWREVRRYYDRIEEERGEAVRRRVYLASDDGTVLEEARRRYPGYEVLGDEGVVRSASVRKRYSDDGLDGIMGDLFMLSRCDFVVCTFSSNICRLIYEMQLVRDPTRTGLVKSLDREYFLV